MKVKEESDKAGLKYSKNEDHGIWSHHFMANRWRNNRNCDRLFIFLGSKIPVGGDRSCEIKRHLFLGRKAMTNLDSILTRRDITLRTEVHLVKTMVFPIVMYGCESWTIRKEEYQRIDVFELWCWRILLRVPWTTRRSNQSILKEINLEYSLEGLMLWTPDAKSQLIRKDLMLAIIESGKRRG